MYETQKCNFHHKPANRESFEWQKKLENENKGKYVLLLLLLCHKRDSKGKYSPFRAFVSPQLGRLTSKTPAYLPA